MSQPQPYRACSCRGADTRRCPRLAEKGHGAWYLKYDLKRASDEPRKRRRLGPFKTKRDAIEAYESERDKIRRFGRRAVLDDAMKLGDHLGWMLAHHDPYRDDPSQRAAMAVRLYLRPGLGHLRIADLTSDDVYSLVAAMRQINRDETEPDDMLGRLLSARAEWHGSRISNRPLSDATIKRTLSVLVTALNHRRVSHLLLAGNPAANLGIKGKGDEPAIWTPEAVARWKVTGDRPSSVMIWTPEQTGAFLDAMADPDKVGRANARLYPLWHLAAYWGMRRSELLRLARPDLDTQARRVVVRRSKTSHGERVFTIDEYTAEVLSGWFARQMEEQLAAGPAWADSGLVFTDELGRPLSSQVVTMRFPRAVKRLGLPPVRLHDLRHGAAVMLIDALGGVDNPRSLMTVAEILGHRDTHYTIRVYARATAEMKQRAADAIVAAIPRAGR